MTICLICFSVRLSVCLHYVLQFSWLYQLAIRYHDLTVDYAKLAVEDCDQLSSSNTVSINLLPVLSWSDFLSCSAETLKAVILRLTGEVARFDLAVFLLQRLVQSGWNVKSLIEIAMVREIIGFLLLI